jgi:hypothetical protein
MTPGGAQAWSIQSLALGPHGQHMAVADKCGIWPVGRMCLSWLRVLSSAETLVAVGQGQEHRGRRHLLHRHLDAQGGGGDAPPLPHKYGRHIDESAPLVDVDSRTILVRCRGMIEDACRAHQPLPCSSLPPHASPSSRPSPPSLPPSRPLSSQVMTQHQRSRPAFLLEDTEGGAPRWVHLDLGGPPEYLELEVVSDDFAPAERQVGIKRMTRFLPRS